MGRRVTCFVKKLLLDVTPRLLVGDGSGVGQVQSSRLAVQGS